MKEPMINDPKIQLIEEENASNASIKEADPLPYTWERLIPHQTPSDPASQAIQKIHLLHYEIAQRYVKDKRVLDMACGTGYGSQMLCLAGASQVVGVDVSAETIRYAQKHYETPGVEFICADAEQFDTSQPFDVVVSFQTLEHLPNPQQFLKRIHHLLAQKGILLLSVPLGETRHIDSYHLQVFSQADVFSLLEQSGFSVELYRIDPWGLTRSDLLRWRTLYPEARLSWQELLFTTKGWLIMRDFIFRGGIPMPELLVVASAVNP